MIQPTTNCNFSSIQIYFVHWSLIYVHQVPSSCNSSVINDIGHESWNNKNLVFVARNKEMTLPQLMPT